MTCQIDIFDPIRNLPSFLAACKSKAYAGIGSRDTPDDVLRLMTRCGKHLDKLGLKLRSGAAKGADTAFEKSVDDPWKCELFLPWSCFCGRLIARLHKPTMKAYEIAAKHHPAWNRLSDTAKKIMARNTHQVLGASCADHSAFVLCWTPDGSIGKTTAKTGGTGQAIRIAHAHGIPIFNLRRDDHREAWEKFVGLR